MFHDDLIPDEKEREQFHHLFGRLSDAVNVSLYRLLTVIKEVEVCAHATGRDTHAVPIMLMYDVADSIDGVSILARAGSARNCAMPLRAALEIGLGLNYILQDGNLYEKRALTYEYFHHLDGLKWTFRADPQHPEGKQLISDLKGDEHVSVFDLGSQGIDVAAVRASHEKKL